MFEAGDIIIKKETIINGRVEKNNTRRLSVVLFSENIDGNEILCTCPIISNYKSSFKHPGNYCYIPYLIYDDKKLSTVKITDISFCDTDGVISTGLKLAAEDMGKVYSKINDYEVSESDKYLYDNIKEHISKVNFSSFDKMKKRKSKILRKDRIRAAKRMVITD